jgi:hypothetical protein
MVTGTTIVNGRSCIHTYYQLFFWPETKVIWPESSSHSYVEVHPLSP